VGASLVNAVKKSLGFAAGSDCQTLRASRKDSPRPKQVSKACQVLCQAALCFQ